MCCGISFCDQYIGECVNIYLLLFLETKKCLCQFKKKKKEKKSGFSNNVFSNPTCCPMFVQEQMHHMWIFMQEDFQPVMVGCRPQGSCDMTNVEHLCTDAHHCSKSHSIATCVELNTRIQGRNSWKNTFCQIQWQGSVVQAIRIQLCTSPCTSCSGICLMCSVIQPLPPLDWEQRCCAFLVPGKAFGGQKWQFSISDFLLQLLF